MAFDIEVTFMGLVFLCTTTLDPTPTNSARPYTGCGQVPSAEKTATAYLVNAREDATICTYEMPGGHEPVLALFDLPTASGNPSIDISCDGVLPRGEQAPKVCGSLKSVDLCISITDDAGCPWEGGGLSLQNHGRPGSRTPDLLRPDYHDYRWLADLRNVEPRASKMCWTAMNGAFNPQSPVISRVTMRDGHLSTRCLARLRRRPEYADRRPQEDCGVRWLDQESYMRYGLSRTVHEAEEFPRVLPDRVVWTMEGIPDGSTVQFTRCNGGSFLYKFASNDRDLRVEVSNLPREVLDVSGDRSITHFRWFYRLVDWLPGFSCHTNTDRCPWDATLPMMPTPNGDEANSLHLVTSQSVHCPPAGTGN